MDSLIVGIMIVFTGVLVALALGQFAAEAGSRQGTYRGGEQ